MAGHLSKTVTASSATSYTVSFWMKLGNTNQSSGSPYLWSCGSTSAGQAQGLYYSVSTKKLTFYNPAYTSGACSDGALVDANAWYHVVWSVNNRSATTYINGIQQSTTNTTIAPLNTHNGTEIGVNYYAGTAGSYNDSDCKLAHYYFIDGTAYPASTFGETDANGVWKPKTDVSVTYGTNGFFLKFENSGSMGTDSSGNGNHFTVNGTITQTVDTPSNVYCTINPLDNYKQQATLSNGNTDVTTGSSQSTYTRGTLGMSAGKWYWEMKMTNTSPAGNLNFGIVNAESGDAAQRLRGASTTNSVAATDAAYAIYANGVSTGINGESVAQNDIVMFAFDADNNALYIGRNGSWYNSGDPTSGASKTGGFTPGTAGLDYFPAIGDENGSAGYSVQFNFGNGYFGTTAVSSAGSNGNGAIFEYDVPTGYYALNTKNLATYG